MNNPECNNCNNCIAEILKVILILQQNVCNNDSCLETCDRGFLGTGCAISNYNTRPIVLYTCGSNGTALTMPISKSPTETTTSGIFRIEKLDECCATCRVLIYNGETANTYTSTNSFFTININCICSIRCLDDTFVEGV